MEDELPCKQVKISDRFYESVNQIYDFGFETFGYLQAEHYNQVGANIFDTIVSNFEKDDPGRNSHGYLIIPFAAGNIKRAVICFIKN